MLRISKGGKLYYRRDESKRWKNATNELHVFLNVNPYTICEIDNNVTLNDVFLLIKKNKDKLIDAFPYIEEFLDEIRKKPTRGCDDCSHLEIYWNSYIENDNYNEKEAKLEDCIDIHLIKNGDKLTGDTWEDFPYVGISLTPINEMKNKTLKLNREYKIYNENNIIILNSKKDFHLIEILSCIFWEITWYGPPKKRDIYEKSLIGEIESYEKLNKSAHKKIPKGLSKSEYP